EARRLMTAAPANDHSQAPPSAQHHCDVTTPVTPVVVFVPGLGLDSRSWQGVRDPLKEGSVVVLLPSMGQPAPRGTDLRVERQAERLLQDLPTGQSVILVGHSPTCPRRVDVATRSRDVAGLVLVGPVTDPAAQTWPRMLSQ